MDFFERYFNFSPDGGDGTIELLVIIAVVLVVAAIATSIWQRPPRQDTK
ncbi:MAG: hypothetical protein WBG10_01765 [Pseudolabrys sp.]